MNVSDKLKSVSFAECILYISFFFVGIFHVYLSCALSVALIVWLFARYIKNGGLSIKIDITFIFVAVLVFFYAFTILWAVDSGYAVFGFFKFLPLLLYSLVLMQEPNGKEIIINRLPYFFTISTVISVGLMYIPALSNFFAVSGRLSGFLQYPNSFAAVLLVGELLLITKERPRWFDYICILILLFGVLYTGSRTVFILAGASNIIALLINKNKVVRLITVGCIGAGILLVLGYCLITNNFGVLERYLNITTSQSTFVGRLLYAHDALPVILSHPFGLGYFGYYFIQQSIQSGVYAIMYIHNDFLQILLDVGWIPALLFIAVIVLTLINKKHPLRYKLVMLTLLAHSCFDFDLQYIAVFMMLLLFMAPKQKNVKDIQLNKYRFGIISLASIFVILSLYFGTAQALARFELHEASAKLYNHNTISDIELMKKAPDTSSAKEIADRVLSRNTNVSLTYSVLARAAYEKGDFAGVIKYKNKAIEVAPFSYSEYWEYGRMLVNGIALYTQAGDNSSAEVCKKELLAISRALPSTKNLLSKYGAAIDHQPVYYFPQDLKTQIEKLEAEG